MDLLRDLLFRVRDSREKRDPGMLLATSMGAYNEHTKIRFCDRKELSTLMLEEVCRIPFVVRRGAWAKAVRKRSRCMCVVETRLNTFCRPQFVRVCATANPFGLSVQISIPSPLPLDKTTTSHLPPSHLNLHLLQYGMCWVCLVHLLV